MPYKDPADKRAWQAEWRDTNREQIRTYHRQWSANNPDRVRSYRRRDTPHPRCHLCRKRHDSYDTVTWLTVAGKQKAYCTGQCADTMRWAQESTSENGDDNG